MPSDKIDDSTADALEQIKAEGMKIARRQPAASLARSQAKQESHRDTVEGFVIAFILAFLFRTFVAEAFVIPTGSMAETLYGRHKDVVCQKCSSRFRVGASEEVDRVWQSTYTEEYRLQYASCPNCRFQQKIYKDLAFKGDRILVNKFPYEFGDPERFDVVVFKFPEDPKTNYIKRLIGLPNEIVTLLRGDVYYRSKGDAPLKIARKPYHKQQELQVLVYDNDKPARELLAMNWPERWAAEQAKGARGGDKTQWQLDPQSRVFTINNSDDLKWIRYRHYVPTSGDWEQARGKRPFDTKPEPILIGDFCSYNSGETTGGNIAQGDGDDVGQFWVGDLTLSCEAQVEVPNGEMILELVEGSRRYRCGINLQTGLARIAYLDKTLKDSQGNLETVEIAEGETSLKQAGNYRLCFANVDDRLTLWVDGKPIQWKRGNKSVDGSYDFPPLTGPHEPTQDDLSPVGIAAKGTRVKVSHLLLQRDIYYTDAVLSDMARNWRELLKSPERYASFAKSEKQQEFGMAPDEFFVLGDNSPRSLDSRLWRARAIRPHAVPRELMVGKAFFVYWPHGVPFLNNGNGYAPDFWPFNVFCYHQKNVGGQVVLSNDYPSMTVPFYPQFDRMRRIH
ncbi:MAG: signal peptidase I [Planctomycetales bacterium]